MKEGYKETKLGWVPENWEQYNLRDLATYRRGSFPQPYGLPEWIDEFNGFPFVQVFDVAENMRLQNATKLRISELAAKQSVFVKKGTVLITIQGSIGRVAVCQYDTYVDRTLLIIQKFLKEMDHWFFAFAMEVLFAIEKRKAPGGTIKTITKEALSSFSIPVPPFIEQQKIASILCTWIEAIQKCEQTIAALKTRNKGLAQQLLSGKKRLKGFEGEWEEVKANKLFKNHADKTHGGKLEVLSATQERGVIPRSLNNIDIKYDPRSLRNYKKVEVGDFVISLRSFQGGIEYSYYEGIVSPAYTVLKELLPISKTFYRLFFKTETFINRLNTIIYGIRDGKQISYKEFSTLKLPYPPTEEQLAIAQVLEEADRELRLHEHKLTTLKDQKKGLMQKLLTGEVRVNVENH
jgi:type I restriction enzyme S subunit